VKTKSCDRGASVTYVKKERRVTKRRNRGCMQAECVQDPEWPYFGLLAAAVNQTLLLK